MIRQLSNPQSVIQQIQAGDNGLREQFIMDNVPFIKRVVRQVTHSFFVEQEDEYGIALEAFNQAINHYKTSGEVLFESYARLVIKNRLLDWIRRQKQSPAMLSLSDCDSEEGIALAERLADPKSNQFQQNLEFEEAMVQLQLQMQLFGLNLTGLTDKFPRHQDSRLRCIRIARQLSEESALYQNLMQTRRLPCAELARRSKVPLKTIEKNRANIILLTLLMHSDLHMINSYIKVFEKECSK
jgi:RNA polymerase sigma factor